jgi:hypothetical protein
MLEIMIIDDKKSIQTIQNEFNELFNGLKLEFYTHKHGHHQGSKKEDQYSSDQILASIRDQHKSGNLRITDDMTTAALEDEFESKFGLHVQVFRKSGNLWLQTSTTDNWTLAKQNEKGCQSADNSSMNALT